MKRDGRYIRYYDSIKGWFNDHPKWHEVTVITSDKGPFTYEAHLDMVNWVYDNIQQCERHCRWNFEKPGSVFRFRYKKDAIAFSLRWV